MNVLEKVLWIVNRVPAEVMKVRERLSEAIDIMLDVRGELRNVREDIRRLIEKPYPVIVTVRGRSFREVSFQVRKAGEKEECEVSFGTVVWLKVGESKEVFFQPQLTCKDLLVECQGGVLLGCRVGVENFMLHSSVDSENIATRVLIDQTVTPGYQIRLKVCLPEAAFWGEG